MEASVAAPAAPPVDSQQPSVAEAVEGSHPTQAMAVNATPEKMFRYSAYLHFGDGASECEHREDGECQEPGHMHAWCRLPNKFQHKDLYEKGSAAKARRLRLLEILDSDAREVLESELDSFKSDAHVEVMIDDLLTAEWAADFVEANKEVREREEYEHIQQDRERLKAIADVEMTKSDEEQSGEFRELLAHIAQWRKGVEVELASIQEPKRQALRELDRDSLVDQLRKLRIRKIGDAVYLQVYSQWEWFICTLKVKKHPTTGRPYERYWSKMGTLEEPEVGSMWGESQEVIDELENTFANLERAMNAGRAGNS